MNVLARQLSRLGRRLAELQRQAFGMPQLPRVVFLHIPKTAGSSVNAHFKHHLGSTWSGGAVGLNTATGISTAALESAREARYVFGHFGWRTLEAVRGNAFAFTVLRDPAARIVSLYRFARMRELATDSGFEPLMNAARSAGFAAFCRSEDPLVRLFIDNAQARTLAAGYLPEECGFEDAGSMLPTAQAHLQSLDFIALAECLDTDFPALAKLAHLPPPRAGLHRNASGAAEPSPVSLGEARSILGERIAVDQALYDFALALRQDRERLPERAGVGAPGQWPVLQRLANRLSAGEHRFAAGVCPAQETPRMDQQAREREMEKLAGQLHFRLEKRGQRYSLCREVDVSSPVRRDDLTLDEAEKLLNTWKLRGFHGG